jgi:hypothetical protein
VAIVEAYVDGLNDVLRAFKALPKEASNELRQSSNKIAADYMVPAWQNAALYYAGPWGQVIADSVKVKRDRVPAVSIGGNRKAFSGGATPTMVRYPSDTGQARESFAPFEQTNWISNVRAYQPAALREWGQAVDRIVRKWGTM